MNVCARACVYACVRVCVCVHQVWRSQLDQLGNYGKDGPRRRAAMLSLIEDKRRQSAAGVVSSDHRWRSGEALAAMLGLWRTSGAGGDAEWGRSGSGLRRSPMSGQQSS